MTVQIAEMALNVDAAPASVLQIASMSFDVVGNRPTVTGTVLVEGVAAPTAQAGELVTMQIAIDQAYTSVSWTLDPTSVPADLAGTDTQRTFLAPYTLDGGDVLVAVTATGTGGTSVPLMLAVTVYPHPSWFMDGGGEWRPRIRNVEV